MPLRALLASLVLAVSSVAAHAGTVAYGEALDTLYAFDLDARSALPIGAAGNWGGSTIANVEGLTLSPDGLRLYAVSDTLVKVLMTIDRSTGQASVIGPLGGNAGLGETGQGSYNVFDFGMSFTCDGRLWLSSGATGSLWQVDPTTGLTTRVGNLGVTVTGLTARGNDLFGAGSQDDPYLYSIDTATARATQVGAYGNQIDPITTASPGFSPSGQLYAILDNVPPLPPLNTQPQWSALASVTEHGSMMVLGDITTSDQQKYPTNATQLPYVGLKGLAISSPCAVAAPASTHPAPALSLPACAVLSLLVLLLAGTSRRLRRRSP
jgi:hypothetical protein